MTWISSCHHHDSEHSHDDHDDHDEEVHDHGSSAIHIEPEWASEFSIEYEVATPGKFHNVIKTSGSIEASATDVFTLSAKKSGIITLRPGVSLGAPVKQGESLATIAVEGVQGGDVNKAADVNLSVAKAEYERLKSLHEERLVTTSVLREAERAYKEAEALAGKSVSQTASSVTSPISGTIQSLAVYSGEYVETGATVAVVAKNSTRILKADLPSRDIKYFGEIISANFVPEGTDQVISLEDHNGRKLSSTSSAENNNGYIPVYFSFTGNPLSAPGGYAEVFLIGQERENVITVPRNALLEIQGNHYIYVLSGDEAAEKRLVTTGATDGERVEIINGLQPLEKFVAKGASIVRMAEVSAVAPPAHTHNH